MQSGDGYDVRKFLALELVGLGVYVALIQCMPDLLHVSVTDGLSQHRKGGLESLLYLSCSTASIAAVVNYRLCLWYASSDRTTDRKARVRLQKVT